jgi:SSS family solute:Na+ symporter
MESIELSILNALDLFIFSLIFILTIFIVWFNRQKNLKSEESWIDLLLMGRKLTLPLFVASLVATWYGGIFGVTSLAFEKGLYNFLTQGLFWYLTYIIYALWIVPKVREFNSTSLPEMVLKKIGPHSSILVAWIIVFSLLPIAAILSLGLFLQAFTGWPLFICSFIGLILAMSYSFFGGLRAIVYSDLIQCLSMVSAVLVLVIFSWITFGSPQKMMPLLPAGHLSWTGGYGWTELFLWGFIALSTLVDPNFYQRTLAAKSTQTAQKGILIATSIWFVFDLCTTLGAFYARAYRPNLPPNQSYLLYGLEILPHGFKGFFLAGIMSCILSTLDSYLFTASGILSHDLKIFSFKPKTSLKINMFLVGISALLFVPFFSGNVIKVWKFLGGFSAACLLGPWLLTLLFDKPLKDKQFSTSLLIGIISMLLWGLLASWHNASLDSFYIGWLTSTLTFFFFKYKNRGKTL